MLVLKTACGSSMILIKFPIRKAMDYMIPPSSHFRGHGKEVGCGRDIVP